MDQGVSILSPDKTILTYRLAGLGSRVGAHVIDGIILLVLYYGLSMAMTLASLAGSVLTAPFIVLFTATPFLYFIICEGFFNGATPGKKALGLRVRMSDGTPITFGAALGRNLLRPADLLPGTYFVGIVAMLMNPKSQRLGDLIANTVVCYERQPQFGVSPAPHTAGIHPFESAVGELRGMNQEEYDALRRFCDRFPELTPDTQIRLLRELWDPLARRRNIPAIPNVHPIFLAEAVVMKYGRQHGLL